MTLLEQWRNKAYSNSETEEKDGRKLWEDYFQKEKEVYIRLLKEPDKEVSGTVKELAETYGLDILTMTGFLDGINDSLKTANPIEDMDEETRVSIALDKERLYKNMVAAKADWLYELPEWYAVFSADKRRELYLEQKNSATFRGDEKVYPNSPCPCGSGKKYKKCCGVKH